MSSANIEALIYRRDELAHQEHGCEAHIIAARAALASAEHQARAAGDLIETASSQARVDQARGQLASLLVARSGRQAGIAELNGQIAALEKAADRQQRDQAADMSPKPWTTRPGVAGRAAIYDRDGAFVGEIQRAGDARRICELVNEIVVMISGVD